MPKIQKERTTAWPRREGGNRSPQLVMLVIDLWVFDSSSGSHASPEVASISLEVDLNL